MINEESTLNPFDYIKYIDSKNILNFIRQVHPKIIALVLVHLEPDKASVILQSLPFELLGDVSCCIAANRISPEMTLEIERALEKKLSLLDNPLDYEEYIAANDAESATELEDEEIKLAEEIKKRLMALRKPYMKILKILKDNRDLLSR